MMVLGDIGRACCANVLKCNSKNLLEAINSTNGTIKQGKHVDNCLCPQLLPLNTNKVIRRFNLIKRHLIFVIISHYFPFFFVSQYFR